jgi:hypothetical protein
VLCRSGSPRVEGSLYTMLSVCTIGCGPPFPGCVWVHNKMSHMLLLYVSVHFYLCHLPRASSEKFFMSLYNKRPWTPWNRVLLERLVKKFLAFYETRRFPILFTRDHHLPYPEPH